MAESHDQETEQERLTRNLEELLQELRVTQTGVQILTGFLLTLPFSQRFADLDDLQKTAYLAILCGSVVATGLIIAPVAFHRVLFRHGQRRWLVSAANRAARAGLASLALTTSGVVWLVFDLVTDRTLATVAGCVSLVFFAALWVAVPLRAPRVSEPAG
ncbi:MAG: sodium:proton antiporter [Nocardioidaceae bacterium]|nr:sodium:proton antiporter [Nocardioidaceae bacterium]NUS53037.1 sodium:proton antiporter [Nocardioidaceae bacterium]